MTKKNNLIFTIFLKIIYIEYNVVMLTGKIGTIWKVFVKFDCIWVHIIHWQQNNQFFNPISCLSDNCGQDVEYTKHQINFNRRCTTRRISWLQCCSRKVIQSLFIRLNFNIFWLHLNWYLFEFKNVMDIIYRCATITRT